jgi:hypothetical protein
MWGITNRGGSDSRQYNPWGLGMGDARVMVEIPLGRKIDIRVALRTIWRIWISITIRQIEVERYVNSTLLP